MLEYEDWQTDVLIKVKRLSSKKLLDNLVELVSLSYEVSNLDKGKFELEATYNELSFRLQKVPFRSTKII
jgi:hypothetical protein